MGRSPLPEKVKQARGTARKSRQREDLPAVTSLIDINVPKHLTGEAKKIYELKVRQCFAMGILQEIDVDALSIYAWEMAELIRLSKELKAEGYIQEVETKFGTEKKVNPKEKVVSRKITIVNSLGSQFGWSPVSRMRLQAIAKGDDKKDDFNDLING